MENTIFLSGSCNVEINTTAKKIYISEFSELICSLSFDDVFKINTAIKDILDCDLLDKQQATLNKIMAFFKKVISRRTETHRGIIYHALELEKGVPVFLNEDHTKSVDDGFYCIENGFAVVENSIVIYKQNLTSKVDGK